ncbi:hypothetical protein MTO96_015321 [Rhipicephalus appendiculatus]
MSFLGLAPPPFFLATPGRPPLPWEQMFSVYLVASRGRQVHARTTQGYPFALFGAGGPAYLSDLTCKVDRRSTSSAKRRSARR